MINFLEDLSEFFKALSDPTRLKLIRLLMYNNEDKLRVIDLAAKIGISQPAVTQHINVLKELNLIQSFKEQNSTYYYIKKNVFKTFKRSVNKTLDISFMRCSFKGKCSECPRNQSSRKKN